MRLSPIAFAAVLVGNGLEAANNNMTYPPARRSDQADVYHGVRVEDPYRWLEDADSAETKSWVAAENALTSEYLKKIGSVLFAKLFLHSRPWLLQFFPMTLIFRIYNHGH